MGTDPHDITKLVAEIEILLGDEEEIYVIKRNAGIYILHGLRHNFVYLKFDSPHFLVGFSTSGEYK